MDIVYSIYCMHVLGREVYINRVCLKIMTEGHIPLNVTLIDVFRRTVSHLEAEIGSGERSFKFDTIKIQDMSRTVECRGRRSF